MITGQESWWKAKAGVLSKEIAPLALGTVTYRDVTQNQFLLAAIPTIPTAQYRSPTFPTAQPVVVSWAPVLPGISTAGFPGRIMQAFPGDGLLGMNPGTRGCVIVTWLRQGTRQVQICDASQGQLAIGNADSVELAFFVELPASSGIAALIRLFVVVSPGDARQSTARLSTSMQDMDGPGAKSAVCSLANWTRCRNLTWHISGRSNFIELQVFDSFGDPIVSYVPTSVAPVATIVGYLFSTLPTRADFPPGAHSATIMKAGAQGVGFSSLSADVVIEC